MAKPNIGLVTQVADILAPFFKDPIDKECSYCKAAKAVIPIIEKQIGEWLLGEYDKAPRGNRIAVFETVIEKLISGQALKAKTLGGE